MTISYACAACYQNAAITDGFFVLTWGFPGRGSKNVRVRTAYVTLVDRWGIIHFLSSQSGNQEDNYNYCCRVLSLALQIFARFMGLISCW
jgi:hypothetical protein